MNQTQLQKPYAIFDTTITQLDVERIRHLVKKTNVFREIEIDVACELADMAVKSKTSGYEFIIARDAQGNILGYTCYGVIPLTDNRFDLYWIVVDPEIQRHRLGAYLFVETEKAIKKSGAEQLYAETSGTPAYHAAQQFYLKKGFQEVARFKDFYRTNDDKVVYCKRY